MSILSPIRGNSTVYEENKNEVFDLIFSTISLKGKADFIDGKSGQALLFDGKSSVKIPHDKALNLTKAHAISFWLKWDGGGASWCPFIAKRSAGGANCQSWYSIFGFGCLIFICIFFFVSSGKSHAGPEGLVGAWIFDEGKGNVAKDASENGHDGEIRKAKWVDGKFGKALEFNGDGAVVIPHSEDFTLE